jgi:hypothetical protein
LFFPLSRFGNMANRNFAASGLHDQGREYIRITVAANSHGQGRKA